MKAVKPVSCYHGNQKQDFPSWLLIFFIDILSDLLLANFSESAHDVRKTKKKQMLAGMCCSIP